MMELERLYQKDHEGGRTHGNIKSVVQKFVDLLYGWPRSCPLVGWRSRVDLTFSFDWLVSRRVAYGEVAQAMIITAALQMIYMGVFLSPGGCDAS